MKRGISLIALIVTIAIIITLVSTIVVTGNNVYNNSKKIKFATEISYVEELIKTYKANNNEYPISKVLYFDVSNISDKDILEQFSNEIINNNKISLGRIDFSKLTPKDLFFQDLNNSDSNDIYCMSFNTGKVYYMKGLKIGNKTYYSLTYDLKKHINYVEKNNVNDGIIFNTKSSFNNQVNIDISIPSSYTDIQVTSSDQNFTFEMERKDQYNIYKTTSLANSVITIKYKKSENDPLKEIKYNVANVDNEPPTFSLSDIKILKNSDTNKEERYVSIENVNDNLSGIKSIKYVTFEVNDAFIEDYFKNKNIGINVENSDRNIIINDNINFITVCVEDNAGNYSYEVKKVGDKEVDYIYDGLILCLDGIKNTRDGHSNTTNVWEDLSGNENDGFLKGEPIWNNNYLTLDGVNDYVDVGKIGLEDNKSFTYDVVISYTGSQRKITILGLHNDATGGSNLGIDDSKSDYLKFHLNRYTDQKVNSNIVLNDGKLHHLVATFNKDESTLYLYIDGTLDTKSRVEGDLTYPNLNFYIGRWCGSNSQYFKGNIYSVKVYKSYFDEEKVQHNYKVDKFRFGIN